MPPPPETPPKERPSVVLVVEDDPEIRAGTVRVLARAGYQVLEAEDGARALELLRDARPDLILSDVAMPGVDGIELCRLVRAIPALRGTLFVLLSAARTGSDEQADGLDHGADGYIARPIGQRELLSRVAALLRLRKTEEERDALIGALQLRTAQLAASNRELEGFAYTVSHDLQAPLRGIEGYAAELERQHRAGLSARAQHCVTRIGEAARRLDQLLEDLLRYARLDAVTPSLSEVDLRGLVDGLLEDRAPALAAHPVELTLELPAAAVLTWEHGLRRLLANLLDNALKFSRQAAPPRITIRAGPQGAGLRLEVSDNGVGFDMRHHDRLFVLFDRLVLEEEFEGTGAGLAIVRKLVEKLGGRVWAESAPGQGATFFVELPGPPGEERPR